MIKFNNESPLKLQHSELINEGGELYLYLIYKYEDTNGIHEFHIPRLKLDILSDLPRYYITISHSLDDTTFITLGNKRFKLENALTILPNKCGEFSPVTTYFADCLVKKYPKEMTLSEIEKKLGHKVKIVNKK